MRIIRTDRYARTRMYVSPIILVGLIAYLVGSVPFGILMARLFGLPDPRTIGSGNIGATNMLRTGRRDVALATLLLDMAKGIVAVMVANLFSDSHALQALAVLMAAVGHMYSPWLKFTGGKGVATIVGGIMTLSAVIGLVFASIWLLVFLPTRYVSLASIAALVSIPFVALFQFGFVAALVLAAASAIAIYKHKGNIERLRAGTEPKMGGKKNA